MNPFAYHRTSSVQAAVRALGANGDAKPLAGGMSLLLAMKHGLATPAALVDLGGIAALSGIAIEGDALVIGAMTTHADVAAAPLVHARLPALAALAAGIGDRQVRYRGTIGGSIANNDPAADYPAACLALDATIVTDRRQLTAAQFFSGFFTTALAHDEIVVAVRFPVAVQAAYAKFAQQASRYALAGVCVARSHAGVRVAVTGAGAHGVFRAPAIEAALERSFTPQAVPNVAPEGLAADLHASVAYRARLVRTMAARAVATILGIPINRPTRHGGAASYP